MATAKERLKIFENIIARVGVDGDVLGEYSKAMSSLNGLQTFQEMTPPITPNSITPSSVSPQGSIQPVSAPVTPEVGGTAAPTANTPQVP
jgi:hypothetical protein